MEKWRKNMMNKPQKKKTKLHYVKEQQQQK